MREVFDIAALIVGAMMSAIWSSREWVNIAIKLTFCAFAGFAAVMVALDVMGHPA